MGRFCGETFAVLSGDALGPEGNPWEGAVSESLAFESPVFESLAFETLALELPAATQNRRALIDIRNEN